jgi:hypothetical protein
MYSSWKPVGLAVLLFSFLAAGCASGVKRADDAARRQAYFSAGGTVARDVTLTLDSNAKTQLADNLKFDPDRLLSTVRTALDAKGLLAKKPEPTLPRIEIVITDIRVRSNFSAVMFGFMAGSDSVTGEVIARDAGGKELQRFTVSASYALGGLAGGQDDTRMGWLYETFTKEVIKEITGAEGT